MLNWCFPLFSGKHECLLPVLDFSLLAWPSSFTEKNKCEKTLTLQTTCKPPFGVPHLQEGWFLLTNVVFKCWRIWNLQATSRSLSFNIKLASSLSPCIQFYLLANLQVCQQVLSICERLKTTGIGTFTILNSVLSWLLAITAWWRGRCTRCSVRFLTWASSYRAMGKYRSCTQESDAISYPQNYPGSSGQSFLIRLGTFQLGLYNEFTLTQVLWSCVLLFWQSSTTQSCYQTGGSTRLLVFASWISSHAWPAMQESSHLSCWNRRIGINCN